MPITNIKK